MASWAEGLLALLLLSLLAKAVMSGQRPSWKTGPLALAPTHTQQNCL